MRIRKTILSNFFLISKELFLGVWILCVLWFVLAIVVATDGFQKQVIDTSFGKSNTYSLLLLFLIEIGVISFILAILVIMLRKLLIAKNVLHENISNQWHTFYLRLMCLVVAYTMGILFFSQVIYKNEAAIIKNESVKELLGDYNPIPLPAVELINLDELLSITNKEREKVGLQPLKRNATLDKAAKLKADDMIVRDYWSHNAPDGTEPWVFVKKAGYPYIYAGENLGKGYSNASDVVTAWMASSTHRDNMLSPNYKDVGFAITTGALTGIDTILVVEMFGLEYTQSKTLTNRESNNTKSNSQSVELATVQNYLNNINNVKTSWQSASGSLPQQELNMLLDSYSRQTQFCQTIIANIETGKGSNADNLTLWNAVLKMGEESAALTRKLNGM